jgi:hypothetical protein
VDDVCVDVRKYAHTCPALLVTLNRSSAATATAATAAASAVLIDEAQPAGKSSREGSDHASGVWCGKLPQNRRYFNKGAAIMSSVSWNAQESPNRLPVTAKLPQSGTL